MKPPNMALQRTRRPRLRSGRSLRSLGSPLNARPLAGTVFYRARYLSPGIGRFLSEDPTSHSVYDRQVGPTPARLAPALVGRVSIVNPSFPATLQAAVSPAVHTPTPLTAVYPYADNRPVTLTDPTGELSDCGKRAVRTFLVCVGLVVAAPDIALGATLFGCITLGPPLAQPCLMAVLTVFGITETIAIGFCAAHALEEWTECEECPK